jgi:hypothetical protein
VFKNIIESEKNIDASITSLKEALITVQNQIVIDSEIRNLFISTTDNLLNVSQGFINDLLDSYNVEKIDKEILKRLMIKQAEVQRLAKQIIDYCK